MNTPASKFGNLVRYLVYVLLYMLTAGMFQLATSTGKLNIAWAIIFVVIALIVFYFYIQRYNRENSFFAVDAESSGALKHYRYLLLMTLMFATIHILLAYLQAQGKLPHFSLQNIYLKNANPQLFWFLIFAQGVLLSGLQAFLTTGFLFSYAFRVNSKAVGLVGMLMAGLIFALLNFQSHPGLFVVEFIIGFLLARSYLYTQSLTTPVFLAMLNGVLGIILF